MNHIYEAKARHFTPLAMQLRAANAEAEGGGGGGDESAANGGDNDGGSTHRLRPLTPSEIERAKLHASYRTDASAAASVPASMKGHHITDRLRELGVDFAHMNMSERRNALALALQSEALEKHNIILPSSSAPSDTGDNDNDDNDDATTTTTAAAAAGGLPLPSSLSSENENEYRRKLKGIPGGISGVRCSAQKPDQPVADFIIHRLLFELRQNPNPTHHGVPAHDIFETMPEELQDRVSRMGTLVRCCSQWRGPDFPVRVLQPGGRLAFGDTAAAAALEAKYTATNALRGLPAFFVPLRSVAHAWKVSSKEALALVTTAEGHGSRYFDVVGVDDPQEEPMLSVDETPSPSPSGQRPQQPHDQNDDDADDQVTDYSTIHVRVSPRYRTLVDIHASHTYASDEVPLYEAYRIARCVDTTAFVPLAHLGAALQTVTHSLHHIIYSYSAVPPPAASSSSSSSSAIDNIVSGSVVDATAMPLFEYSPTQGVRFIVVSGLLQTPFADESMELLQERHETAKRRLVECRGTLKVEI